MYADLAVVEAQVREALANTPMRAHLKDVLVEADRDDGEAISLEFFWK